MNDLNSTDFTILEHLNMSWNEFCIDISFESDSEHKAYQGTMQSEIYTKAFT